VSPFLAKGILNSEFFADFDKISKLDEKTVLALSNFIFEHAISDTIEAADFEWLRSLLKGSTEKPEDLISVVVFITKEVQKAIAREFTEEAISCAADELFDDQRHRETFKILLSPGAKRAIEIEVSTRRRYYLRSGNPRIREINAITDLRPIFAKKEDEEVAEPVLISWLPLVTLEIVSELNEIKENHLFLLDKDALEKLTQSLERARKELMWLDSQHLE
jgi:hypothetical protein